jgi:hypothetical protein
MAKEEDKIDIEDIEEPEDNLDIEEAVSEDHGAEKVEIEEEPVPEVVEETKDEEKSDEPSEEEPEKDVLEKSVEESKEQEPQVDPANELPRKKKFSWKTFAIVAVTVLITAALVLGVVYYFAKAKKSETKNETAQTEIQQEAPKEEPNVATKDAGNFVYINSESGLNMREEPNVSAKVIVIIPFGTKLAVIEEKSGWYKAEYSGKQGWINKDFTQIEDPFLYKNTKYGFSLTFPQAWAGYKIFEKDFGDSIALYVAIPTTDKAWTESGPVDKGYASLFAIAVYTKAKWETAKVAEGPKPTYLGTYQDYVITWSSGQAAPTDLTDRFPEIKTIIATYKSL